MIELRQVEVQLPGPPAVESSLLMPLEVRLRSQGPDTYELLEVRREDNDQEGETEHRIPTLSQASESRAPINILSYYNRERDLTSSKLKLAVCICAYNEPRSMLQKSLLGIHRSLKQFRRSGGISSNQIVVLVIFDGIEKVNNSEKDKQESILSFFERIDVQSGLYYEPDGSEKKSLRFEEKYKKYAETANLVKQCKPENRKYDLKDVPQRVLDEYKIARDEALAKEYGERFNRQAFRIEEQEKYDNKTAKRKHTLEIAYQKVKNKCQKSIKLRDDTSLVYPMKYKPEQMDPEVEGDERELIDDEDNYLNVLMVIKHKNAKKLSSHALFFLGFCTLIKPEICMLLDIGLEPQGSSIFNMYKYMIKYPSTGGSCGYMGLKVQRPGDEFGKDSKLEKNIDILSYFLHQSIFDIQKAQRFEYHMGHLIDKAFEALFDFIHVLPGAFSCYRYQCVLRGLTEYLSPALDPDRERSLEEQNTNLAEDRILSLGLKSAGYNFAYLPDAYAVVDPMKTLYDMMGQRKRWINGSWFAFFGVVQKRNLIQDNKTQIQIWYYQFMHAVFYVSIGIFFSTVYLTVKSLTSENLPPGDLPSVITSVVSFTYIIMIGSMIFLSLNQKAGDARFQAVYYFISTMLGIYGIMVLVLMIMNLIDGIIDIGKPIFTYKQEQSGGSKIMNLITIAFMLGTVAMYGLQVLFASYFSKGYWGRIIVEVVSSVHHFLFFAPTYLHNMMIYAFCKIDDFSWGTKGLDSQDKAVSFKTQKNKIQKYVAVFKFLVWNIIIAIILCILIEYPMPKQIVLIGMGGFFFVNTFFKFVLSFCYLFCYACTNKEIDPQIRDTNIRDSQEIKRVLANWLNGVRDVNEVIEENVRRRDEERISPVMPLGKSGYIWDN